MTDTVTTLATGNISEEVIAEYLQGLGIGPMEPLWEELDSAIRPHIPQFLAAGGTYEKGEDDSILNLDRPTAVITYYGGRSLLLTRRLYTGHLRIKITPTETQAEGKVKWLGCEVEPERLDDTLCDRLRVPEVEGIKAR